MSPYLDPRVDLAFKRVFGEHQDLLKSFLNALLPLPPDAPIESLEYLPAEQAPEIPGLEKSSIVDVKCTDTNGRIFIVEMQMHWSASFMQRMVFSGSQAYVKQLHQGQNYRDLKSVYALAVINQVFDRGTDAYLHHYAIINVADPTRRIDGLEFVFVELPKFKPQSTTDKRIIKWLRFLTEVGEDAKPFLAEWQGDSEIQSALGFLEAGKLTPVQLEAYRARLDAARVETTLLDDKWAEGKAEGKAEGEALAIVKMIRTMHTNGLTAESISTAVSISLAQVRRALEG